MYFGQGVLGRVYRADGDPPAAGKRIRALDPEWDGKFPRSRTPSALLEIAGAAGLVGALARRPSAGRRRGRSRRPGRNPTEIHRTTRTNWSQRCRRHRRSRARALRRSGCHLRAALDHDEAVRNLQLKRSRSNAPDIVKLTRTCAGVDELDVRGRLPLVDMSLPALRAMAPPQYREFSKRFRSWSQPTSRVALFEWTLHRVLLRHLRPQFEAAKPPMVAYYALQGWAGLVRYCFPRWPTRATHPTRRRSVGRGAAHLPKAKIELLPPRRAISDSSTMP